MSDLAKNNRPWCCSSAWTFIFQLATSYLPPADAIRRFSFLKRPHQTPHPVSLFEKGQTIDQGSGAVNCSRGPRGKKRGRWSDVAHHAQCWLYQPGRGGGQLWSGVAARCDRLGAKICVVLQVWAEKGIKQWTESFSKCEIKAKCGPSEY